MGYSPGYGVGVGSCGARRGTGGVAMKREEDEISVSFSVRRMNRWWWWWWWQKLKKPKEEEKGGGAKRGWLSERRWDEDGDGG